MIKIEYNEAMKDHPPIYLNIKKFLENNGFNIIAEKPEKIVFEFTNSYVSEAYSEFDKQMKEGEALEDRNEKNLIYRNAWANLEKVQEEYYPKLQPILVLLNSFYQDRNTSLEFMIFFNNEYLPSMFLGFNSLYQEIYPNKVEFLSKISYELQELDNFIK